MGYNRNAAATEPQVNFIRTLRRDREMPSQAYADRVDQLIAAGFTGAKASDMIDALKLLPFKSAVPKKAQPIDVPAGRYALVIDGQTEFFKVERPERGRWSGFTFLTRLTGENHEPARYEAILGAIAANPAEAVRRYGHFRNECGYCCKNLTDQFSRFYGVGPKCARDHGMPFSFASYLRAYPQEDQAVADWLAEDARTHEVTSEDANREWAEWKNEAARREAEQETAAFMAGI
jgi:hypothetical protein